MTTNRVTLQMALWGLPAVVLAAAAAALWDSAIGVGVLAGGLWNVLNLGCLVLLLAVLVERSSGEGSRRKAFLKPLIWLVVKFPLLYGAIIALFMKTDISYLGFGIGFTVALGAAVVAVQQIQATTLAPHGR